MKAAVAVKVFDHHSVGASVTLVWMWLGEF